MKTVIKRCFEVGQVGQNESTRPSITFDRDPRPTPRRHEHIWFQHALSPLTQVGLSLLFFFYCEFHGPLISSKQT